MSGRAADGAVGGDAAVRKRAQVQGSRIGFAAAWSASIVVGAFTHQIWAIGAGLVVAVVVSFVVWKVMARP